jgi:hypothetical protein
VAGGWWMAVSVISVSVSEMKKTKTNEGTLGLFNETNDHMYRQSLPEACSCVR